MEAGGWAVEVKHGKQIPRTLLKWWGQAEQNAGDGKRPLLVLHPAGAAYAECPWCGSLMTHLYGEGC